MIFCPHCHKRLRSEQPPQISECKYCLHSPTLTYDQDRLTKIECTTCEYWIDDSNSTDIREIWNRFQSSVPEWWYGKGRP